MENDIIENTEEKDPNGYFKIHVVHGKGDIILEYYSNNNQLMRTITGKKPEEIYKSVAQLGLFSSRSYYSYLGYELAKAYIALTLGLDYQQGKHLEFPPKQFGEKINYMEKIQFKTNEIPEKDKEIIENKLRGIFFTYIKHK